MNTFKRNSVCAAVLAGLGTVGAVGTAEAVYVNPDGTGQALIYPYYTVRGAKGSATAFYDTYMTLVNSTTQVKVVKVRFMEGRRSQEVLDFNLFLSPNDTWVGAVTRTANGARLITGDRSCVAPAGVFTSAAPTTDQTTPNVFKNYAYTGTVGAGALGNPYSGADGVTGDLDRTREGHFEVFEMGVATDATLTAAVTHNSAGTPANCTVAANQSVSIAGLSTLLAAPNGGLFGGATLINVLAGTDYSYDAVALEQVSLGQQYVVPGYPTPNLMTGNGAVSALSVTMTRGTSATSPAIVTDTWSQAFATGATMIPTVANYIAPNLLPATFGGGGHLGALQATSAVLMHDTLMNEYVVETGTSSATDWIVTFPTKGLMVAQGTLAFIPPFGQNFNASGSCEPIALSFFDREEQFIAPVAGVSPLPVAATNSLCWETNVISFGTNPAIALGTLTGSSLSVTATTPYANGWASISLNTRGITGMSGTQNMLAGASAQTAGTLVAGFNHKGLPVVGFSMQDFSGGVGPVSNYGGGYKHKSTTLIN